MSSLPWSAFKQHPAVVGWYAYDEPIANNIPPEIMKAVYHAIKTEDPERPVAVVFAGDRLSEVPKYINFLDIYMVDRYPLYYPKPEFNNLKDYWRWMQQAAYYAEDKLFWPVLQAFGEQQDGTPKYKRRLPTAAEERYMFYTAVLAGADGLIFYGHHWTLQSWVDSVLTPLIEEFDNYVPAINSQPFSRKVLVNRFDVQAFLYKEPTSDRYLLIAVHHGRDKVKAVINLNLSVANNFAQVLDEDRQVKLLTGILQDYFNSYAVHIYAIH
ncbi:hypothetical protein IQ238_22080 [Pleurocapsales cyanobacterium LEGE 06147]|nr:hypothetical protein [Pleurocapsales cyanobacterium LEGE 06147]